MDWVTIELREKGLHLIGSDWLGEVQIRIRDFRDGKVHENWYRMGEGPLKTHTQRPRGFLHLAFQLKDNKYDRPFSEEPTGKRLTFDEWRAQGMQMPGAINVKTPGDKMEDPRKLLPTFDTIEDAEHRIGKDAWKILLMENPTEGQVAEMAKLNRVNCLHKGNFEQCTGKRYMICIDGTQSAKEAFHNALKLVDPSKDHVFIVTVREKVSPSDFWNESDRTILTHKLWRAAAGIVNTYQDELERSFEGKLEYTSIMPAANDAREMVVALAKKYKADVLVIGKHKDHEVRHQSKYFRSFQKYCQGHAPCTVMTF